MVYAGFYTPHPLHVAAVGTEFIYPLVVAKLHNSQDSNSSTGYPDCAFTRIPGMSSSGSYGFAYYLIMRTSGAIAAISMPGLPGGSTNSFSVRGAMPVLLMTHDSTNVMAFGALWGSLSDVATVRATNTVVRGDTTTVAGSPWILTTSSGSFSLLFKA